MHKLDNSKISADKIEGQSGTTVTITAGHNLAGSGSGLTALPAGNLTGTVADARISALTASKLTGALPAISGASLTGIPTGTILQLVVTEDTSNYSTSSTGLTTATSVTITPQLATSYIVLESRFFPHLNHTANSSQGTLVGLYEGTTLLGRPYGHRQPGQSVSVWHTYSAHTVQIVASTGTTARTFHFKFSNTDTSQSVTSYASVPGHVTNGTLTAYNRLIATEYR